MSPPDGFAVPPDRRPSKPGRCSGTAACLTLPRPCSCSLVLRLVAGIGAEDAGKLYHLGVAAGPEGVLPAATGRSEETVVVLLFSDQLLVHRSIVRGKALICRLPHLK